MNGQESAARTLALRRLAAAPRTSRDLYDYLVGKGVDEASAQGVVDRFTAVRLIDDEEYARVFTRSWMEHKGLSKRAVAMRLQERGVPPETVERTLAEVDERAERSAALALARARAPRLRGLDGRVAYRRLAGYLGRKGYSASVVAWAVARALEGESATAAVGGGPATGAFASTASEVSGPLPGTG